MVFFKFMFSVIYVVWGNTLVLLGTIQPNCIYIEKLLFPQLAIVTLLWFVASIIISLDCCGYSINSFLHILIDLQGLLARNFVIWYYYLCRVLFYFIILKCHSNSSECFELIIAITCNKPEGYSWFLADCVFSFLSM